MSDLIDRLRSRRRGGQDRTCLAAADEIERLRAALAELVALKELADQFDAMKTEVHDYATVLVLNGTQAEYLRRKPLAWQRARELVGSNPTSIPPSPTP